MASLGPRIIGHPDALIWHRLINVAIGATALLLVLLSGLALVETRDEALIYAVSLGCIPVASQLAGSVNNDNLAFLAGAIVLFGSQRFLRRENTADLALIGCGVIMAGATKLTALLLCGGFFVAFAFLARRDILQKRINIAVILAALLLAALPSLHLWLTYGSPAPDTPAQHALLVDGARSVGWDRRAPLDPPAYLGFFFRSFIEGWMPHLDARSPLQAAMLVIPWATTGFAMVGMVMALKSISITRPAMRPAAALVIVAAGAASIAATMIIHIVFSYSRHLSTGWMMDAYPRYYLPLVAIVPLATLIPLRILSERTVRPAATALLIAAPLAFGMLG